MFYLPKKDYTKALLSNWKHVSHDVVRQYFKQLDTFPMVIVPF